MAPQDGGSPGYEVMQDLLASESYKKIHPTIKKRPYLERPSSPVSVSRQLASFQQKHQV